MDDSAKPSADVVVGGVDAAKGAWLLALVRDHSCSFEHFDSFVDLVDRTRGLGVVAVGVDMPIGLPANGARSADVEARAVLGARRSSLFPTPAEAVLAASDYDEALRLSRAVTGKGISKQAFNLLPMIRQVRGAVDASDGDAFFEAHPETTFAVISPTPLSPKKTVAGIGQRLQVLDPFVPDLAGALAQAPSGCGIDDALDAVAAAWSAHRFISGTARVFGADAGVDAHGYPLRIIA